MRLPRQASKHASPKLAITSSNTAAAKFLNWTNLEIRQEAAQETR